MAFQVLLCLTVHWQEVILCFLSRLTCGGAVVSNVAVHVDGSAVDSEVPHATHKVSVLHRKVFGEIGNPAEQQRPCQVQRPAEDTDRELIRVKLNFCFKNPLVYLSRPLSPQRATEVKHQPWGVSDKFEGWPLPPPWPSQLPHTRSRREAAYTPSLWNTPHQTQRGFRRFNVTPKNKTPTESLDVHVVYIRHKHAWLKMCRDHSESLLEFIKNLINRCTDISDLIRSDVLLLLKLYFTYNKRAKKKKQGLNHRNNKMHWGVEVCSKLIWLKNSKFKA